MSKRRARVRDEDVMRWAQEFANRAKAGDPKAQAVLDELRGVEAEASAELAEEGRDGSTASRSGRSGFRTMTETLIDDEEPEDLCSGCGTPRQEEWGSYCPNCS